MAAMLASRSWGRATGATREPRVASASSAGTAPTRKRTRSTGSPSLCIRATISRERNANSCAQTGELTTTSSEPCSSRPTWVRFAIRSPTTRRQVSLLTGPARAACAVTRWASLSNVAKRVGVVGESRTAPVLGGRSGGGWCRGLGGRELIVVRACLRGQGGPRLEPTFLGCWRRSLARLPSACERCGPRPDPLLYSPSAQCQSPSSMPQVHGMFAGGVGSTATGYAGRR